MRPPDQWSVVREGYHPEREGSLKTNGGSRPAGDRFTVEPRLPEDWSRLRFRLKWRGADFVVDIRPGRTIVENLESARAALPLTIAGTEYDLAPGQSAAVS